MRARLPDPLPEFARVPLTIPEAAELVTTGTVKLLTSDVFDTVVWRPVPSPHHLFVTLAERLLAAGHLATAVDPHAFALTRVRAEHAARVAAREAHGSPECTLEELWAEVPAWVWSPGSGPGDGCAAELEVEAAALHVHPGAVRVLTEARRLDIPVALVSDSYFSGAQLADLVTAAGLDVAGLGIEVVTSSDRRRNKWDGLLGDVMAEHGGAERAVHIGDNPFADLVTGDRLGARVVHADLLDADDAALTSHEPWELLGAAAATDGGRSAAIREVLANAGPRRHDPGYQFGVEVAGPIMAGFAGWVSATADELGAGAVHCLLREGARIAELIDVVRPDGPPRVLVHASRWGIMRAAVLSGTERELERALARRAPIDAAHVAAAFGLDVERVAKTLPAPAVEGAARREAYAALAADDELREQIVTGSAALRRGVLAYLDRTLVLDDGPLVLTDIGWGGTIQEGLTAILDAAGIRPHIVGLYALLSPPGETRAGEGADLRSYLPVRGARGESATAAAVAVRHPEFLERINTPALGTLLGFSDDGVPETRPDDHDVISPSLAAAQAGVSDFCTTLAALALGESERQREWFTAGGPLAATALDALATTVQAPDPRLAESLGTWEHDDVAGTAAEALSNAAFGRWARYANAVDVGEVSMHDVYWVAGVAATAGGALAGQLAAVAAGANSDSVAPHAPTGLARVAVFAPGETLAAAQTELVPRLGGEGWSLLRFDAGAPGVRSVRIDVGAVAALVEIGDASLSFGDTTIDGADALVAASRWIDGRWLGGRHAVVASGGHLLIDPDPPVTAATRVAVTVAFRAWPIEPATVRTLLPQWRTAAARQLPRLRRRR